MKLQVPRKFKIWEYITLHSQLIIRSPGVNFPEPEPLILIKFRAVSKMDLKVYFNADSLEIEDGAISVAEFVFPKPKNKNLDYEFGFKEKGIIVGKVTAGFASVEIIAHQPNQHLISY
jgi:hypothetical protein